MSPEPPDNAQPTSSAEPGSIAELNAKITELATKLDEQNAKIAAEHEDRRAERRTIAGRTEIRTTRAQGPGGDDRLSTNCGTAREHEMLLSAVTKERQEVCDLSLRWRRS